MYNLKKTLTLSSNETKLWLCSLASLFLCFLPLIFNFVWGNHDWLPIKHGASLTSGIIEGRFSQFLFLWIFLDSHILPILNTILGFSIYTLTLTLLATRFFEFKTTSFLSIIILILTATLPYINEITYFQFIIFSQLFWYFTIFLALMFGKKATQSSPFINTFLSTIFLFISIGGYPASANLFVTSVILYLTKDYSSNPSLKAPLLKAIPFIINIIISFGAIYFIYKYFQDNNKMLKLYNNETITLTELILKIPSTFLIYIKSQLTPQPFFSLLFKLLSFCIFFSFFTFYIKQNSSPKDLITRILFCIATIIGLKFSTLLTKETADSYFFENDPITHMVRADFYSIPTFMLFCLFFITNQTSKKSIHNLIFLTSIILIFSNINSNFTYSKTQILGFKAETNLLERTTSRIENSPLFSPETLYTLVQADEISLRPRYYQQSNYEKYGLYTLHTPFTRYWLGHESYNFYSPKTFIKSGSAISPKNITPEMITFLSQNIQSWPSKYSVYVNYIYAIIAQTHKGKNMLQEQFKLIPRELL